MQAPATFFLLHAIDALSVVLLALLDERDVRDVWDSNNYGREMFILQSKHVQLINSIKGVQHIMLFMKCNKKSSIELVLLEE